jgi:hypothetical protein
MCTLAFSDSWVNRDDTERELCMLVDCGEECDLLVTWI